MKLIYKDPHCSSLQVVDCKSKKDISKVLDDAGMNEDQCGGDTVYYVFVDKNGKTIEDKLDFT